LRQTVWVSEQYGTTSSIERSHAALRHKVQIQPLRDRYASLGRREREVVGLVVSGQMNKQVRGELGISEITVQAHRGRVMRKIRTTRWLALCRRFSADAPAAVLKNIGR
jgi:FixJ family two-component response regulator